MHRHRIDSAIAVFFDLISRNEVNQVVLMSPDFIQQLGIQNAFGRLQIKPSINEVDVYFKAL
ncbi:hypothetical protein D0T11_20530 [Hymenobacter rubripertinctus]|uniref:Uncharacterized protein n=1 Tax=Hymenobacter rubripertinctus TaxID=2029981 RepID=A0A418QJI8_9BACT|nr:hypothetical protein D0T11_20530 [Hymenobacter rubripertinctus]